METKRLENFSTFYFDTSGEDIEYMISELKEAGIDPEKSSDKILKLIKKERINLKIEKGKRITENYFDLKRQESTENAGEQGFEYKTAVGYRKKSDELTNEDLKKLNRDANDLNLLKKIVIENE